MATGSLTLLLFAVSFVIPTALANSEGDALNAWKRELADPNNVLQSWDPTLVTPCTWFHVSCNSNDSVVRLDLGEAGLSGRLVPELGLLSNLQYLEVFTNNLTGSIPDEIGQLRQLKSLDLYENKLSGSIPTSLGNLTALVFLRLDSNNLRGEIPDEVFGLIRLGNLRIMNVSDNSFDGTVDSSNSTGFVVTTIVQDAAKVELV